MNSVSELENTMDSAAPVCPPKAPVGSDGRRGPYCRLAGVPLIMAFALGITGLAVDLAGQVPSAPLNLRINAGTTYPPGPRPDTCPAGAIHISPGTSIQTVLNAHPGNTAFCLKSGVHSITSAITPKTGNIFVGEYGAILDGTGWTTT